MALTKVTTGTIASETIKSANIEDGAIVNADVNASAAIVASKLSGVESGFSSMQIFTSSGTWNKPTGITKVIVEVQGAGASGIRANATGGRYAGGGGGGYARKVIDVSSISTATITVGAGGVGTNSTTTGNAGGSSIWADGTNTVTGGGAPTYTNANDYVTGAGGTGTGGDLNVSGQAGGGYQASCEGGASFLGSGGLGILYLTNPQTNVGILGGGGCGHQDNNQSASSTSGAGAVGIVFVTEYK